MSSKQALDLREAATALLVFFSLLFWLLLLDCVPSLAFIIIVVPAAVPKMVDVSPLLSSSFSLFPFFLAIISGKKNRNKYYIYMNSARQIESSINAVRGQKARLGIHTHTHTHVSQRAGETHSTTAQIFSKEHTHHLSQALSFFFFLILRLFFFFDSARIAVRAETRRNSFLFSY